MTNFLKSSKNIIQAMIKGELLLRMNFDRFIIHIAYIFILIWSLIYCSLKIDQTLFRLEGNRRQLEDLKIYHAQKTSELASYNRLSTIDELLKTAGSDVTIPKKPADRIKK